jgi:hypothetical protein
MPKHKPFEPLGDNEGSGCAKGMTQRCARRNSQPSACFTDAKSKVPRCLPGHAPSQLIQQRICRRDDRLRIRVAKIFPFPPVKATITLHCAPLSSGSRSPVRAWWSVACGTSARQMQARLSSSRA